MPGATVTGQQCDCEKGNGTSPRHFTFFFIVCALKRAAAADASRSGKEKSVAVSRRGCATPLRPREKTRFHGKKITFFFFFFFLQKFTLKFRITRREISTDLLFGDYSFVSDMRCNFLTKVRRKMIVENF